MVKLFNNGAVVVCIAAFACALTGGCATSGVSNEEYTRLRADVDNLQQEIAMLNSRMEDMEAGNREAGKSLSAARSDRDDMQRRLDAMERNINAVDQSREKDKKEIVSKLSDKIVEVVNKNQPPARGGSDYGYEHVVQSGETLSKIAAKYGVKQEAILQANGLANPDLIRAGQKLFVPAK